VTEAGPAASAAFDLAQLRADQARLAQRYLEFLRVPALSLGLYRLAAGAQDEQRPHTEDEAYVVLSGRARLRVGETDHDVAGGAVVYVPAHAPHAFHAIVEDLLVLVVFAPAEGTAGRASG
jgi:mannose-6-phosphate isomerase-like protein (cupin superfamily)